MEVQETNLGLDMNGTQQALAYSDDVNLTSADIRTEINTVLSQWILNT